MKAVEPSYLEQLRILTDRGGLFAMTLREAAGTVGVSITQARRVLEFYGMGDGRARRQHPRLTPVTRAKVEAAIYDGQPYRSIARKVGCHERTVRRVARKLTEAEAAKDGESELADLLEMRRLEAEKPAAYRCPGCGGMVITTVCQVCRLRNES